MGLEDYTTGFFAGLQLAAGAMVFAVALVVLFGRFLTADESLTGLVLRGGILSALAAFTISQFATIWYWLLLPLALIPLAEVRLGEGLAGPWLNHRRHGRLAEAVAAAADQPRNAIVRLQLARALLETCQIDVGLQALHEAVSLAPPDSGEMLDEMARELKAELVRSCLSCRSPNPSSALACRHCFAPLTDSPLARLAIRAVRPARRLLPRRS
jgi:hypothetical protein